ncbi:MAG: hypothetical protein DMF91_00010 [Acidobacteria bacterium]|nr:MAG: hypothetical protein DMF91_00010 [Acidobacteriota bacterium]
MLRHRRGRHQPQRRRDARRGARRSGRRGRRRRNQVSDAFSRTRDAARRCDGVVCRRVAVRPADAYGAVARRALRDARPGAEAADFLEAIGVPAFKTGSGELTNLPLQRHIARKHKPMIVSTGMSTPEEIDRTVQTVRAEGAPFALMHCTSTYPTPYEHVQLGYISRLQERYRVPVGLSDHTLGSYMAFAAAATGANLFEKHVTVSRSLPGPDQQGSMEPAELRELVQGIRAIEKANGATKTIQPGEQDVRNMAHHSVVSIREIAAGATIAAGDVWAKRPGTGIPARQLDEVIGRVAKRSIPADRLIRWEDLEPAL